MDWFSAFVGGAVILALSFGADRFWLWFGESPSKTAQRKAARRLAKWEAKHGKRRGLNAVKQ